MTNLTIALSDEDIQLLTERAARLNVRPEDLVQITVEDLIHRTDAEFDRTLDHVLAKNTELYQRLA